MTAARERGLDGVVITEHFAFWNDTEIQTLRRQFPDLQIFRGIEISTTEGEDLLVYGSNAAAATTNPQSVATVMEQVRGTDAAVILAHPLRYRDQIAQALYASPPDACEGWSMNIYAFQRPAIQAFCEATGCGMTAATDSHSINGIGAYATRFHGTIKHERDLAAALREHAYSPFMDPVRLAEFDQKLPERVARIRQALAEGLDNQAIHERTRAGYSFIDHIRAGRYPAFMDPLPDENRQSS